MGASNFKQTSCTSELKINSDEEQEYEEIKEWCDQSKAIRLMVTGKTGVGKSTLLNGIIGEKVFKVGEDFNPETSEVSSHKIQKAGIDIELFDTPGLQDGSGKEQQYLSEIKEKCTNIHLLLYCIEMSETRSDLSKHSSAITLLTNALGPKIWENAVLLLTFANRYEKQLKDVNEKNDMKMIFKEKIEEWEQAARNSITKAGVSKEIAEKVNAIPVGIENKAHLECCKYWMSCFWTESLFKMKEEAQCAMVKISVSRFKNEDEIKPEDFDKHISEQPIVVTKLDKALAGGITTTGAAVGATTGALIGTFLIGIPTFGVAAGVGLLMGAVIGGGIGGGSGAGVGLLVALHRRRKKKIKIIKLKKEALEKLGEHLAS